MKVRSAYEILNTVVTGSVGVAVLISSTSCAGGMTTSRNEPAAQPSTPAPTDVTPQRGVDAPACASAGCTDGLHVAVSPPLLLDRPYAFAMIVDGAPVNCTVAPRPTPLDRCDAVAEASMVHCSRQDLVSFTLRGCVFLEEIAFPERPVQVNVELTLDRAPVAARTWSPAYTREHANAPGCRGCVAAHARLPLPVQVSTKPRLPRDGWVEGAQADTLLAPWSRCSELPRAGEPGDGASRMVRSTLNGVEVSDYSAGSGRWATFLETRYYLARGGCDTRQLDLEGGKESPIHWLHAQSAAQSFGDIAALLEAVWVEDAGLDELAAARMLVQQASETEPSTTGADLLGAVLPVQPDHPGRPHGSPRALWDAGALASANVAQPRHTNETGQPLAGLVTAALPAPVKLRSAGRWELWEIRFAERLGGGLLAAYDVREQRTRWVLGTEIDDGALPGRSRRFELLAFEGDLVLVRTREGAYQRLWAIELARGVTREVAPGQDATFHRAGASVIVRTRGNERRVSLAELTP